MKTLLAWLAALAGLAWLVSTRGRTLAAAASRSAAAASRSAAASSVHIGHVGNEIVVEEPMWTRPGWKFLGRRIDVPEMMVFSPMKVYSSPSLFVTLTAGAVYEHDAATGGPKGIPFKPIQPDVDNFWGLFFERVEIDDPTFLFAVVSYSQRSQVVLF